jgi:hypothetical protein
MNRRMIVVLAALPLLLLAGCAPSQPTAAPAPTVTVTQAPPVATPTPTPTPTATTPTAPTAVNSALYSVAPHEWAFYTDASKNVWCEIYLSVGSPDEGGCWITSPAANAQATFTAPGSIKAECGSIGGYGAQIGGGAGLTHAVNWWGCYKFANVVSPAIAAKTQPIPDNSVLHIAPLTATVVGGVVKFTDTQDAGASLTYGLTVASFVQ